MCAVSLQSFLLDDKKCAIKVHLECIWSAFRVLAECTSDEKCANLSKTEVAILMRLGTGILRAGFSSFESADRVHDKWCGKI